MADFNPQLERTHTARIDVERTIRSMSCNVPGHNKRLNDHCERVRREYFDSGLHHRDMHPAEIK